MEKSKITFIDLFAGIGGFHVALHNVGAQCVYASEWDKSCRYIYEENFRTLSPELFKVDPHRKDYNEPPKPVLYSGDITKVDTNDIPDHDILCAGFPCQPFSISGHKKGFNDTRGTLFFNVLEIIKVKQPKVVFLENVKHLIHHDKGNTLRIILEELENAGYKANWKVFNAKDFGLAQNRERIIIIANKNKYFDFTKIKKVEHKVLKEILDKDAEFEYLDKNSYTILSRELWRQQHSGLIFCGYRNKTIRSAGTRPNTEHLSRVHKQPNRIYHIDGTHPTLPSQESSGRFWIFDGKNVRKLTINECYKLQGFPSNFVKSNNISSAYNQIGNSVAIPMIESIFREIKEQYL
jgi:DNA (cytosine-5)-methyltransferase 1